MGRFKRSLQKAERFRVAMAVTIGALVLLSRFFLKYPLSFLAFLVLGLFYAVYRITIDRNGNAPVVSDGIGRSK